MAELGYKVNWHNKNVNPQDVVLQEMKRLPIVGGPSHGRVICAKNWNPETEVNGKRCAHEVVKVERSDESFAFVAIVKEATDI